MKTNMNDIEKNEIRVLLADDQPAILAGMQSWLKNKPNITVIETAARHDEVLYFARLLKPDVIVLDIEMPGSTVNARKVVKTLKDDKSQLPKIIMYSSHWGREFIDHYLKLGSTGFLAKLDGHDYLVDAILSVMSGDIYYGRHIFKWINKPTPFASLTTQEFEVFRRVAGGHSNAEIGDSLCITEGTVRIHVSAILRKLNVSSRSKAIVLALTNGVEPYDPPEWE